MAALAALVTVVEAFFGVLVAGLAAVAVGWALVGLADDSRIGSGIVGGWVVSGVL